MKRSTSKTASLPVPTRYVTKGATYNVTLTGYQIDRIFRALDWAEDEALAGAERADKAKDRDTRDDLQDLADELSLTYNDLWFARKSRKRTAK